MILHVSTLKGDIHLGLAVAVNGSNILGEP